MPTNKATTHWGNLEKVDILALIKDNEWFPALVPESPLDNNITKIEEFLKSRIAAGARISPNPNELFQPFHDVKPTDVRVVILNTTPFASGRVVKGRWEPFANGRAFGVSEATPKLPPATKNILTKAYEEVGYLEFTWDPTFAYWGEQGVLMLNTFFTTDADMKDHSQHWDWLIRRILAFIDMKCQNVVWIVPGEEARQLVADCVDSRRHTISISSHPHTFTCKKGLSIKQGNFIKNYPSWNDSNHFTLAESRWPGLNFDLVPIQFRN